MSYLYDQEIKGKKYVYLITGYRDENGKVRQKRKIVGKVDPVTGERQFKNECVKMIQDAGIEIPNLGTMKQFSEEDIKQSSVRSAGFFHLMENIGWDSGLLSTLKVAFPDDWKELFVLAAYMIISKNPVMYCADWLAETEAFPVKSMTSQRISELLSRMTLEQRNTFYRIWNDKNHRFGDYLALDITSVSSYSTQIEAIEWGHNRDGEALPQVNLCMLMAEKARVPLFQTTYSGSLSDVTTLRTTLQRFEAITGNRNITIITDKGFASQKNIRALLDIEHNKPIKFLAAMPFTTNMVRELVEAERNTIDSIQNTIIVNGKTLRARTKVIPWENTTTGLYAHIYYDPTKATASKERLYSAVYEMLEEAAAEPLNYCENKDYLKFLSFDMKSDGTYQVQIRAAAVNDALRYSGWLVLLSNRFNDAKNALQAYRDKDVVEKGFYRLKNSIDLDRLRIHGNNAMESKLFIGFLCSILLSKLNSTMVDQKLYSSYTMFQLLKTVEKQKVQVINKHRIYFPATKEQKMIYSCFNSPILE